MLAPTQLGQQTPLSLAQRPMTQQDADRKRCLEEAWESYRGNFKDPLKVAPNQPNDNVKANRCAPIVDKGTSFLFGDILTLTPENSADQDFVDGLWGDDDSRMTTLSQMAINGGVCGSVFVKIIPATGGKKYPRLVLLDPLLMRMITAPDDCTNIWAYVIEYETAYGYQKRQIISKVDPDSIDDEPDEDATWTITNYIRRGLGTLSYQGGTWQQVGEQEEWPYPFAPIITSQNLPNPHETWGQPDLTPDIIGQNKVLNFLLSNISRIMKYHGHPITFATGVAAQQINIAVDDLICLPAPDSKIQKIAAMENFAGALQFVATIMSNIDEQSRVPAVALGRLTELPKGNISGVALQLLFQPLIEKTMQKRRLYGALIREVTRTCMVVSGKLAVETYEDYEVDLNWPDMLPADDITPAQRALLLQQLGVSKTTLLTSLGFDAEAEMKQIADEQAKEAELAPPAPGPVPPPPSQPVAVPGQTGQPGQAPPPQGGQGQ